MSKIIQDFDTWAAGCDEEELQTIYGKVKLRRNIYAICLIFMGPIICPFWLRTVYITKAIEYRSFDVKFSNLTMLVYGIFSLCTLFIFPLMTGWIIRKTEWGTGLGGWKGVLKGILYLLVEFVVLGVVAFILSRVL